MNNYDYPYNGRYKITCEYGVLGNNWSSGKHGGTDFVGLDNKNILAISDGIVLNINHIHKNYGNHLEIRHPDGNVSRYAHFKKISVKKGDAIKCKQIIGIEGNTGNSTGSHLHLEIKVKNNKVDPKKYIQTKLKEQNMEKPQNLVAHKSVLKTKIGLSDDTINFLEMYKYGDELIEKIAKAVK